MPLACRDKAKADDAIFRIRQKTPDADLAFLPLDLSDLKNVRTAAEPAAREPHVDVLINNAAVASSERKVTAQGFEQTFGVNHLGCFACQQTPSRNWTASPRPWLRRRPSCHVLQHIDFNNPQSSRLWVLMFVNL